MNPEERRVLRHLRFDHAQTSGDVWRGSPYHIAELHAEAVERITDGLEDARACAESSPIGVAVRGEAGAGKTHLLGTVRERTQRAGGYFSLIELTKGVPFWQSAAAALKQDLLKSGAEKRSQLHDFLGRLAEIITVPNDVREIVLNGRSGLTPQVLDLIVATLRRYDAPLGLEVQDTLRALILLASSDLAAQDVGDSYLQSDRSSDPGLRDAWGFRGPVKVPQQVLREMSRLLALTGPTVIAIDQLDSLFAQSTGSVLHSGSGDDPEIQRTLGQIADSLLQLRETTRRTLTVVACLPDTWALIKRDAAGPVPDRFRETLILGRIPTDGMARLIVAKRLEIKFAEAGFRPPFPTWPVAPTAFDDTAGHYTPRVLIKRVEAHIAMCVRKDEILTLDHLDAVAATANTGYDEGSVRASGPGSSARPFGPTTFAALDARFAELRLGADVAAALDPLKEDKVLPELLAAGLRAWVIESRVSEDAYNVRVTTTPRPPVHATLRQVLEPAHELEVRWLFRGIASPNANAVISRVRAACTTAVPVTGRYARRVILLRNTPWPRGPRTTEVVEAFTQQGGEVRPVSESDLRIFAALRTLLNEDDNQLPAWLATRRPARSTALLQEILVGVVPFADAPATVGAVPPRGTATDRPRLEPVPAGVPDLRGSSPDSEASSTDPFITEDSTLPAIAVGTEVETGGAYAIDLASLRKHTIVFAGSGSGKTVLIRRMVEECALLGVSSIVLDPNNDLARLGDPWPTQPAAWSPGDSTKAAQYHASVEVVIWTPGVSDGRPLILPSLPDLSAAPDDSDEQREILDEAINILGPRAKLTGATGKAAKGEAILRQALLYHARRQPNESTSLTAFIKQLANLPAAALSIPDGPKIAADLAGLLEAAKTNDSLFAGSGTPLDPGLLLTPSPGKRARVSVISFIGLSSEEQRQAFVNQLQIALFTWIKAHPERDRPLGGLYVMDEAQTFAPTSGKTPCTGSTNVLAAQARKYGLGLVFATQAPRNLQTKIANNCATQFVGMLSGTANLDAARDIAKSKGSSIPDIGVLTTGTFYAARPGEGFTRVQTPLCLTHHAPAPLTRDEVVARTGPGPGRRRRDDQAKP
ncbi:AAA family ATPase [Catenulispora pinisilvae]|uniref:AAA family ATPase n=1 Tax=Catenulispora pinisilvae TaxID=2705253 RepID=UPI001890C6AB|nr:AAA family ATPase [Catenulispora pinisilvae]